MLRQLYKVLNIQEADNNLSESKQSNRKSNLYIASSGIFIPVKEFSPKIVMQVVSCQQTQHVAKQDLID
jgi:hypothetical protein